MNVDRAQALDGVKVLDLTQAISGPFCTLQLADLGAEVIKVERPDYVPKTGPFINGIRTFEMHPNRGKKSITLNLKDEKDKGLLLKLAQWADVIVENFRPGVTDKLGIGYEDVKKINPEVIYCSISGFGQYGPYRDRSAFDMVIQGMSGLMSMTGELGGRPLKTGVSVVDMITGLYAATGILAAWAYKQRTGKGQWIDIAMLDSAFAFLEGSVINYFHAGTIPKPMGNYSQHSAPFQCFETADGEIIITANTNDLFRRLCEGIGRADLLGDPRYAAATQRRINMMELEKEITAFTKSHTTAEVQQVLDKHKVPNGIINDVGMICNDPQIAARNMIVEAEHSVAGKFKMQGSPLKMSRTTAADDRPSPALGEHNYEVFSKILHMSDSEIEQELNAQKGLSKTAEK